jgi:hypothetical protein
LEVDAPAGALDHELLAAQPEHKAALVLMLTSDVATIYLASLALAAEQERIGTRMWASANANAPDRDSLVDEFCQHSSAWRAWRDSQTGEAAAIAQRLDREMERPLLAQMDAAEATKLERATP